MIVKNAEVAAFAPLGALPIGHTHPWNANEVRQWGMNALFSHLFACISLTRTIKRSGSTILRTFVLLLPLSIHALSPPAHASIAYGSINNFDTVNDTGVVCHGFEIEIDDIHSKDITYTYDYNHYGIPKITEDNTDPLHPKVFIRYQSVKNLDGTWASYTAIPAGPIPPTAGHQFTNPSLNFGGEHFGAGFYGTPLAVKYNWLKDDGTGHLIHAGAVNIATPTFTYFPPIGAVAAQVQAAIVPPPPPAPPILEFGAASWVKETKTSSHNKNKVELKDLVSVDPNDPTAKNWKNGEPDEVEVEWQLSQTDFNAVNGGANGEMVGAAEKLPNNDEVITRRYDFFKYVGPIDPDTGEALADTVGADGIHGVGIVSINGVDVDLSKVIVVGDYVGAQMAGFDAAGKIGLIDHLQDGDINVPYIERTIVIGGAAPIVTTKTGALPAGMKLDLVTGVLSGTPTSSGTFTFTVHSTDANGGDVTTTYNLTIVPAITDVTGQITVSRGGYRLNRATGRFVQTVKLTNKGGALTGPVSLVLDSLSANASLFNKTGVTSVLIPAGSPYLDVILGSMAAGASISVTLEFNDPTKAAINYSTRVLAGTGSR